MPFDVSSIDAAFIVDFLKENGDELALLIFAAVQSFLCFWRLKEKEYTYFLLDAALYFPAVVLVFASLFCNVTWNMLSGYVMGASLFTLISTWGDDDGDNEFISKGVFTVLFCLSLALG